MTSVSNSNLWKLQINVIHKLVEEANLLCSPELGYSQLQDDMIKILDKIKKLEQKKKSFLEKLVNTTPI